MNIRFQGPSWGLVAGLLVLAAFVWAILSGPNMVGTRAVQVQLSSESYDALQSSLGTLTVERRRVALALERATWIETLIPPTLEAHERGEPLALDWLEGMTKVQDELAFEIIQHPMLEPVSGDEVAVGMFAVSAPRARRATFYGIEQGTPYCIVVEGVPERGLEQALFPRATPTPPHVVPYMLQACTWVRRYGIPGEHVGDWFEVNYQRVQERSANGYPELPRSGWDALDLSALVNPGPVLVGIERRACRAGSTSICALEWRPVSGARSSGGDARAAFVSESFGGQVLEGLAGDVLSRMQDEFGEEAMLAFWTSDQPFEKAFKDAFGLPPGDWVGNLAVMVEGPVRPGPMPRFAGSAMGLLLSIASVLIGIVLARLRRIG